ncbi:MAG: SpoIIE family protein phosphatase [Bacteroidota bacterium]|jgi:serine phosphatase RsbU (regulator of sigma subunit)
MKIGIKLTLTFFGISLLAMLVAGVISYRDAKETLQEESFKKLTAIREMKSSQVVDYFTQIEHQLLAFAENPSTVEAMKGFKEGFRLMTKDFSNRDPNDIHRNNRMEDYLDTFFIPRLNAQSLNVVNKKSLRPLNLNALLLQELYIANNKYTSENRLNCDSLPQKFVYNNIHKKYHHVIRNYMLRFGFYDVFFIDNESADIVYTVYKEIDFASSLESGAYRNTNLARAFNGALSLDSNKKSILVDFEEYLPSYNLPASFIACPVKENGKIIGVVAFQMPIDNINKLMTNNNKWKEIGLGTTGETYIVGEDFTLRNQSRFLIEDSAGYFKLLNEIGVSNLRIQKIKTYHSTVGLQEVKTKGTREALTGKTANMIFEDYRGIPVLSSFMPLNLFGMKWVILSEIDESEAFEPAKQLRNKIINASIVLIVFVLLISYFISRKVTKPIKELEYDAYELAKGNLDVEIVNDRVDEIGSLASSFQQMQHSIKDLIHGLEDKVLERTQEVVRQKDIIEHKQKEIVDSLNYAGRIQSTLLANETFLNKYLPNHFILFKPKDIVSGDFYFATKTSTHFYIAVCDSTGHGVPGAIMSILNMAFINEAIGQHKLAEPDKILNHVRERLINSLSKYGGQDGMDGILFCIDLQSKKITYAAANNAPILIRKGEVIELECDKMPIGKGLIEKQFRLFEMNVEKDDLLVAYTDGFADQFGGPKGKKLMYKPLKQQLLAFSSLDVKEQKLKLDNYFEEWRGDIDQVDDVCVLGIKF